MEANMKIAVVLSAVDRMSSQVAKAVLNSSSKLKSFEQRADAIANKSFQNGQQMVASGLAVGAPLYEAITKATEFESKMVDIRKQVSGLDQEKPLRAFEQQIFDLSKQLPIATGDIQDLIAAGARMDIPRDKLVQYTKDVTKMSVAFDIAAGDIGESMGKIAKVYNVPIDKVNNLADSINTLDDNAISKGGEIIEVMQRIGGAARNLSPDQAAALASTFLTLGEAPERASSGISGMINDLATATNQSRKFQEGLNLLGLSATEVQKRMSSKQTAQATILDVLERVNKLSPEKQSETLVRLFGQEHGTKIQKLANSVGEYRRQLGLLNGQQKGSMDREYQKRVAASAAQQQIFKNRLNEVVVKAGQALLPTFNKVLSVLGSLMDRVGSFISRHQTLVKYIALAAGAFTALALVGGYLSFVIGGLARIFSIAANVANVLVKGFQVISTAWKILNALFTTNLIILAIMAIALGVFLVIKYWDQIKAFFTKLFQAVVNIFKHPWESIKNMFLNYTPQGLIIKHWSKITGWFSNMWDRVKAIFISHVRFVTGLGAMFFNAGRNIVLSIGNGIKAFASKPIEAIKGIVQKIRNHLPFSPAKEGPLRDIHKIKLVETIAATIKASPLVNAFKGALNTMTSTGTTNSTGLSAGGGMVIHFNPVINLNGSASQSDAKMIASTLKQQVLQVIKDEEKRKARVSF
jgi:TP901 family phage tail tape measure protein